ADKQAFTGAAGDQVDRVVDAVDELVGRYPEAGKYTSGAILWLQYRGCRRATSPIWTTSLLGFRTLCLRCIGARHRCTGTLPRRTPRTKRASGLLRRTPKPLRCFVIRRRIRR